jgi:hypothetical protein
MLATFAVAAVTLSIQSPAAVQAVAADAHRVAYAAGFSGNDCNRVYVWNLRTRSKSRLGRRTHCQQSSTGNGISGVSLAGTRAVWLQYQGGNRREYTLWTATTTRPTPILIASHEVDVDDPAPILLGAGGSESGGVLPYAVGRTVRALRTNGSRRFSWTAPARIVGLHAHGSQIAVATDDSTVTVLDSSGRVLRREVYSAAVRAVRVTGAGVLVHYANRLELRDGAGTRGWRISTPARLEDADSQRALYVHRGELRTLRYSPYADRGLRLAAFGRLEGERLVSVSGRIVRAAPFR